jgi:hypothetical protein
MGVFAIMQDKEFAILSIKIAGRPSSKEKIPAYSVNPAQK